MLLFWQLGLPAKHPRQRVVRRSVRPVDGRDGRWGREREDAFYPKVTQTFLQRVTLVLLHRRVIFFPILSLHLRLLHQLPGENLLLLRHVVAVLHCIQGKAHDNQMNAFNLSVCIAPSMLWAPAPSTPEMEGEGTKKVRKRTQRQTVWCGLAEKVGVQLFVTTYSSFSCFYVIQFAKCCRITFQDNWIAEVSSLNHPRSVLKSSNLNSSKLPLRKKRWSNDQSFVMNRKKQEATASL